jgi:putative ABC transport system ATP-binding protein
VNEMEIKTNNEQYETIENIIQIKDLKKSFDNGKIIALNGIDLTIKKGEFVSIIGPSGSGKSTLLNMLGALDQPDEGSINVAGYNLTKNIDLNHFRSREIGFIFQLHNLIPNLKVVENVEIPMYEWNLSNKEMREKALELLIQEDFAQIIFFTCQEVEQLILNKMNYNYKLINLTNDV